MTINNPQSITKTVPNSSLKQYQQNYKPNPYFTTEDIALASWLHSNGIKLLSTDNSCFPTKFIFENHTNQIDPLISVFQTGKATGNICAFYRSYKILLKQVKTKQR